MGGLKPGREFRGLRVAKDHAFEPLGRDAAIYFGSNDIVKKQRHQSEQTCVESIHFLVFGL